MNERAALMFEKVKKQMRFAKDFFNKGELDESVHYIRTVFENCLNIIKDIKNNEPLFEHKPKIDQFNIFYVIGVLSNDYSEFYRMLEKLRLRADLGSYSKAPQIPGKNAVKNYLDKVEELFKETEKIIKAKQ